MGRGRGFLFPSVGTATIGGGGRFLFLSLLPPLTLGGSKPLLLILRSAAFAMLGWLRPILPVFLVGLAGAVIVAFGDVVVIDEAVIADTAPVAHDADDGDDADD